MEAGQPRSRRAHPPGTVPAYLGLVDELRGVQDRLAAAAPPPEVSAEALAHLRAAAELLGPWRVEPGAQLAGRLDRAPGRGTAFAPVPRFDEGVREGALRGSVVFGRFHVGVGSVHGGAVSVVFDEFLGRLARSEPGSLPRTAYLHVAYRNPTPPETELVLEGSLVRSDGRKRVVSGVLRHGDVVCAEAEALFVLLPLPQASP